jgi:acetylornithine deacetylase/succinyl-diaminopimelate desuccinylase-like protein
MGTDDTLARVADRVAGLDGAHGPDEYATLAGLEEHIVGAAAFLLAYAELAEASA